MDDKNFETEGSVRSVTVRRCNRCRNHGYLVELKGHKHFCQYRDCTCQACVLLEKRKEVCRQAIALRRKQDMVKNANGPSPPVLQLHSSRQHPYLRPLNPRDRQPLKEPHHISVTLPNLTPCPNYVKTMQIKTTYNSQMRNYMNITKNVVSQAMGMTTGAHGAPATETKTLKAQTRMSICTPSQPATPGLNRPPSTQPIPCLCEPTYTTLRPVSHVGLYPSGSTSFNPSFSRATWMESPF
ncbi:doublesex- and mab-3-related transcription factor 1-like, partial [Saccostrea cucullata]|uniref:doublesex- and mab-3-related transcription factor 1-like n=1 Tax=Saccostrea cuccullata TaxID=36930 RepID=UPI002ED570AF